ncbi:TlpA family protein disulfide reductase [Rhizobium sp. TRM96647]|uniref:thiol:disulfide interchange protein TlpA n=1 Tax=unclassified Rhizobium TaxID=2613769 RepID=UPI0021E9AECC|nr:MULTISPECIES: TlpA disulfide reductase family protein [unclassified Rhizobium]MCV3734626.1 TlpA family protein disulfide reductase [Rhizobium sp. TRM96647]MCV3756996.1 TlpA family protein disulfide reductase [Rhizobium sp. TRM96650]
MTVEKKPGRPAVKLIALAALAGILAGAAAVYVMESRSGNGGATVAGGGGQCPMASDTAATLAPFFTGQVAAMMAADDPRPLPQLSFNGPDGQPRAIADFAGKTLLVNLWATWCVPCREEMPALNALQKELGSDRFEVVAINIDTGTDEKPKAFLDETGVHDLGYYRDSSMGVFNALKKEGLAFGLPVTLLMDDKGCLVAAMNGPAAWDSEDAKALIRAAVPATPGS